ncbi:ketoacyl-ACP synthase III family protein [Actinomadura rayongensis]|uniref:3-oxoacyl-ACP synthase n=1 Tax=Actinomadura rayongensis TaxID=1429076 RepID=A0A6I4W171_9ACTN|nr:ketoacyl-ACP synthase III family protein [Actinomadura rayongensis]MXQ63028.1 3-oxoacyl-ACP synthase [Actinomadura rayongensis]
MRLPDTYIAGLGSFLPETVTVETAVRQGLYPAENVDLHEYAGCAVAGPVPAPEMGLRGAQEAVERSGLAPTEFDLLLYACTWHQGPDGWLPHSYLQRYLVGGDVPGLEIRQGCNGMFAGLDVAASYLHAVPERGSALLVAADNYGTPLLDRWRPGLGLALGDAATAVVLTKRPGFAQVLSVGSTTIPEGEEMHRSGEPVFPPGATVGRTQDFGARAEHYNAKRPAGSAALKELPDRITKLAFQVLDEAGVGIDQVTRVGYVNHSREIVEQRCMALLGLPLSKSVWEYGRTIGHCGASDQFLAFHHLLATGELLPGDHMLLVGMAPGVVLSAAVIKVLEIPAWLNEGKAP